MGTLWVSSATARATPCHSKISGPKKQPLSGCGQGPSQVIPVPATDDPWKTLPSEKPPLSFPGMLA